MPAVCPEARPYLGAIRGECALQRWLPSYLIPKPLASAAAQDHHGRQAECQKRPCRWLGHGVAEDEVVAGLADGKCAYPRGTACEAGVRDRPVCRVEVRDARRRGQDRP